MSLRTLGQILRFSYNFSPDIPVVMNSHKNRKYVIDKHRCFAKKAKQQNLVAEERSRSCPGKKDKKDSFWGGLFGSGAPKKQPKKVADCCEQQKGMLRFTYPYHHHGSYRYKRPFLVEPHLNKKVHFLC